MGNIKAYINYDAIPSEGFKYQVEITINDEVDSYVSVMDDSQKTIQKVLNEFKNECDKCSYDILYDEKNDVHYMGDSDEKELEEIKRIDNENKIK